MGSWQDTSSKTKSSFERLLKHLAAKNNIVFDFHSRPGISYSLRTALTDQSPRPFFAIIDIIDDPDNRWLSVCFYEWDHFRPGGKRDFHCPGNSR